MSDSHHAVDPFIMLKMPCGRVGGFNGIKVFQPRIVTVSNHAFRVKVYADKANFLIPYLLDYVRLDESIKRRIADIVVRRNYIRVNATVYVSERIDAVVNSWLPMICISYPRRFITFRSTSPP